MFLVWNLVVPPFQIGYCAWAINTPLQAHPNHQTSPTQTAAYALVYLHSTQQNQPFVEMSRWILTLIMEMENESLENEFSLQRGQFPLCFFFLPAMFVQEWCWVVDGEILAKLLTWWIYVNLLDIPWTKVSTKISNDSPKNLHSEQFAPIPSTPAISQPKTKTRLNLPPQVFAFWPSLRSPTPFFRGSSS